MSITKLKRAKRQQLSNLQTHIAQENCVSCEFNESKYPMSACEGCSAFKQLNDIGNELLQISAAARKDKPIKTVNPIKEEKSIREYKSLKDVISLDIYNDLKNQGFPDTKIAVKLGIKLTSFRKWKRREGLTQGK